MTRPGDEVDGQAPVLVPGDDQAEVNARLAEACGGAVGLSGVLADLNRVGEPAWAPGEAVSRAFAWDRDDARSRRWWPQGITSSSEARLPGEAAWAGPPLLVTTAYAKSVGGLEKGCRITVADLTDPGRVRYRHVLLTRAVLDDDGHVDLRPVRAHAGGVVWHGPWLYVAATRQGVLAFHLDDLVPVAPWPADRVGRAGTARGERPAGFGHAYALPLRRHLAPPHDAGGPPMRYSFLSLARSGARPGPRSGEQAALLAGEYDPGGGTRRLVAYDLDRSGQLAVDRSGRASSTVVGVGVERMQGAVWLPGAGPGWESGRLVVSASNGRYRGGHLWTGPPGDLTKHAGVLPVGPEALTAWPERQQLWTLTEYPGLRFVVAVDLRFPG
jgi:hypothetical protein